MPRVAEPIKLKRGTQKRLAKHYGVSKSHISLVASGKTNGRAALVAGIEREAQRQQAEQNGQAAA